MSEIRNRAVARVADRIDLALDLLTLGQYGLEQLPADDAGCEGGGPSGCREALPPARRRGCAGRAESRLDGIASRG